MVTKGLGLRSLVVTLAAVAGALALSTFVPVGPSADASPVARLLPEALRPPAKDLVLTGPVIVELVDARAAGMPADDFIGLGDAYYAYDAATSTYWAAAGVVPSSTSYEAQVASQDDGSYTVFHKPAHAAWVAQIDGMAGSDGATCASYHVSIPAPVLAVWHWPAGTCLPPSRSGRTPVLLTYFAKAWKEWWGSVDAGPPQMAQGAYWLRAAQDLRSAVAAKAPGTRGYTKAADELVQLAHLPMQC